MEPGSNCSEPEAGCAMAVSLTGPRTRRGLLGTSRNIPPSKASPATVDIGASRAAPGTPRRMTFPATAGLSPPPWSLLAVAPWFDHRLVLADDPRGRRVRMIPAPVADPAVDPRHLRPGLRPLHRPCRVRDSSRCARARRCRSRRERRGSGDRVGVCAAADRVPAESGIASAIGSGTDTVTAWGDPACRRIGDGVYRPALWLLLLTGYSTSLPKFPRVWTTAGWRRRSGRAGAR